MVGILVVSWLSVDLWVTDGFGLVAQFGKNSVYSDYTSTGGTAKGGLYLEIFASHDVLQNPDIENDFQRSEAHIARQF